MAVVRELGPEVSDCELTHLEREPIDVSLAARQHAAYQHALSEAGCRVTSLPALAGHPDAVFVEDTAVVVDEVAVITRPGAPSRRAEAAAMAPVLQEHRPLRFIEAPGTLDGGDVLVLGRQVYVGQTPRTNREGFDQLTAHLAPFGYRTRPVPVEACLHLKTAVTAVAMDTLLVNPAWVDLDHFRGVDVVTVDPTEPWAGNALWLGERVVYPAEFPKTAARLEAAGVNLIPVDAGELAKAEGGVTCCSLVFSVAQPNLPNPTPA